MRKIVFSVLMILTMGILFFVADDASAATNAWCNKKVTLLKKVCDKENGGTISTCYLNLSSYQGQCNSYFALSAKVLMDGDTAAILDAEDKKFDDNQLTIDPLAAAPFPCGPNHLENCPDAASCEKNVGADHWYDNKCNAAAKVKPPAEPVAPPSDEPKAAGESCGGNNGDCAAGLFCNTTHPEIKINNVPATNKCVAKLANNSLCFNNTECSSNKCVNGKCAAPATPKDAEAPKDGGGKPAEPGGAPGGDDAAPGGDGAAPAVTCTPTCEDWQECQNGKCTLLSGSCATSADCKEPKPLCDATEHICKPKPVECDSQEACNAGYYCPINETPPLVCSPKKLGNESCVDAYECKSDLCDPADGCQCKTNDDCPTKNYCDSAKCLVQKEAGEACAKKEECQTEIGHECKEVDVNGGKQTLCVCHAGQCPEGKFCLAQTYSCADLLPAGAACAAGSDGVCKSGKCEAAAGEATGKCTEPTAAPANGGTTGSGTVASSYDLPNMLGTDDPSDIIGRVINYIIGLTGTLALVLFIYGGSLWLISAGRAEYVDKGKDTMLWAVIGLALIFSSYVLVKFILKLLGSSAGG